MIVVRVHELSIKKPSVIQCEHADETPSHPTVTTSRKPCTKALQVDRPILFWHVIYFLKVSEIIIFRVAEKSDFDSVM
jgi:hypothetical protein